MSKYRKFALKGILAGAAVSLMAVVGFMAGKTSLQASTLTRDCDATSIINCGALSVSELVKEYDARGTKTHYSDIPAVYNNFGITADKIHGLTSGSTKWAWGQVKADNTVWMNGKMIGSGAITAGRVKTANSVAIPGTSAFRRPPSDSFARPTTVIDAFIGFENGVPAWAVLTSCGNPVNWNKPNITIKKEVAKPDLSGWVKDATYKNGDEIRYLLTVSNTGKVADTNVSIIDYLPAYQTYVAGSTKINGVAAGSDNLTKNGLNLGTIAAGQTVQVSFRTKLSVPATKCGVTNMTNKARVDSDKAGPKEDTANTNTSVTCISVACTALSGTDSIILGETAKYAATASATGTTISKYTFNVNGKAVQSGTSSSFNYTPTAVGTYSVNVVVTFANGQTAGGSGSCAKVLSVKPKPVVKTVKCLQLNGPSTVNAGQTVSYTTSVSDYTLVAAYGFTVNGASAPSVGNKLTYTFANAGTYTVKAKITPIAGVVDGGSEACVKTVTVVKTEEPVYKCDSVEVSDSEIELGEKVSVTINFTASNGATFDSGSVDFGDGSAVVNTATSGAFSLEHTYKEAKEYTIKAKVTFMVNGKKVTSTDDCSAKVKVVKTPKVCKYNENLPENSPECFEHCTVPGKEHLANNNKECVVVKCKIPGKEQFDADDEENCVEVKGTSTTKEITDTGAGSMIGLFTSVTLAGAFLHNLYARRAASRQ